VAKTGAGAKGSDVPKPEDVELRSGLGLDYGKLRDLLAAGEWEEADAETRAKLCEMAGPDAVDREWVYFSEVRAIPVEDLQTVDRLWLAHSGGKFGFSVQRKIWVRAKRQWAPLFAKIDWTQGGNNAYRKFPMEFLWDLEAPKGHLPLTNCLRGTQLFAEVLEHPAFAGEPKAKKKGAGTSASAKAKANMDKVSFNL